MLKDMSTASDSIADGDLIDKHIRSHQYYGLLPIHGCLSCIKPGKYVQKCGTRSSYGSTNFPQWLGKYSSRNKQYRLYKELSIHMSNNISGGYHGISMDYFPLLKKIMILDMNNNGNDSIDNIISFMKIYNLSRDDWDIVNDSGLWGNKPIKIDTKIKRLFTKKAKGVLVNHQNIKASKGSVSDLKVINDDDVTGDNKNDDNSGNNSDDNSDSDMKKDNLIKQTKTKAKTKAKTKTNTGNKKTTKRKKKK